MNCWTARSSMVFGAPSSLCKGDFRPPVPDSASSSLASNRDLPRCCPSGVLLQQTIMRTCPHTIHQSRQLSKFRLTCEGCQIKNVPVRLAEQPLQDVGFPAL